MGKVTQIEPSTESMIVEYSVTDDGILLTTFFTDQYKRMEDLADKNVHLYAIRALGEALEENPPELSDPYWYEVELAFETSKKREVWEFKLRGANEVSALEPVVVH